MCMCFNTASGIKLCTILPPVRWRATSGMFQYRKRYQAVHNIIGCLYWQCQRESFNTASGIKLCTIFSDPSSLNSSVILFQYRKRYQAVHNTKKMGGG